jgi:hypothetical protein
MRVLVVFLCALLLVGCQPTRWQGDAVNDSTTTVVFRVTNGGNTKAWLLPADGGVTIVDNDTAVPGVIELIDPASCTVWDKKELPSFSFVVSPGPNNEGAAYPFYLVIANDAPPIPRHAHAPTFTGCPAS